MNRRQAQARRSRGALLLMVLAFLSVLAPVLADTYLCPMAQAAQASRLAQAAAQEHQPTCCQKAEMPAPRGTVQWQMACECPKLDWDAAPAEFLCETHSRAQHDVLIATFLPLLIERTVLPRLVAPLPTRCVAPSGPPLWVRHQAILC